MKASLLVFGIMLTGLALSQDIIDEDKLDVGAEENEATSGPETPDTTTPDTTTTPATTTTTTPSQTTTTLSPTVEPTGEPELGKYYLNDGNHTCVLLEMRGRLEFTYTSMENNKTSQAKAWHDIPAVGTDGATVSGNCYIANANTTQQLDITFFDGWLMSFLFNQTSKDQYDVEKITLTYKLTDDKFPNTIDEDKNMTTSKDKANEYKVDLKSSFRCDSELKIDGFKNGNLTLFMTWDLKVEAFRKSNDTTYGDAMPCDADTKVSNIVPIVVGAALAGLVLIVLIAYLIGRQRNKRGYQSV